MTPDWNIVDDEPAEVDASAALPPDGLDHRRVRAAMLDRLAAHRRRQWSMAVLLASFAGSLIAGVRGVAMWQSGNTPWLAAAIAITLLLVTIVSAQTLRRHAR